MSDWKAETSSDLQDAEKRLEALLSEISGNPTAEQMMSAWRAYVWVEKSIAFIRVEIDEENPGRFIKIRNYAVPDERQAVRFALNNLKKGEEDFRVGDYKLALRNLRESRNYLRALLRANELKKARKAA